MIYGVLSYLFVNGKVLMVKKAKKGKDPNSGFYTLPGGKLEDGERGLNPIGRLESAIRESKQETGLTPINLKLRGIILFDNNGRIFENWPNAPDYLVYIFSSNEYSGELIREGDSGEIPAWVDEKDVGSLPKNPGDIKMYEWLKNPDMFFGVIKHKGKILDEENTFVDYF